jgi:uncharacterized protein (TIGR02246 family)
MGEIPLMSLRDEAGTLDVIASRREKWIAAINAGDAEGFVAVLTDDAVWLPWQQPAISGKERIRDWLSAPFAEFTYDYSVTGVRVRIAGAWAVERARFRTRAAKRAGGDAPTHEGIYTVLWRHTPSVGWLIERYIDHTGDDDTSHVHQSA